MAASIAPLGVSANRAEPGSGRRDTIHGAGKFQALLDGSSPQASTQDVSQPEARSIPEAGRGKSTDTAAAAALARTQAPPTVAKGGKPAAPQSALPPPEEQTAANAADSPEAAIATSQSAVETAPQSTPPKPSVQAVAAEGAPTGAASAPKHACAPKHGTHDAGTEPALPPASPDPATAAAAQQPASQQAAAQQAAAQIAVQQAIPQTTALPANATSDAEAGLAPISGRQLTADKAPPKPASRTLASTPVALPSSPSADSTTAQSESANGNAQQTNETGSHAGSTTNPSAASQPNPAELARLAQAAGGTAAAPRIPADLAKAGLGADAGASGGKAIGDTLTSGAPAAHFGASTDASAALNAMAQPKPPSPPTLPGAGGAVLTASPTQALADARDIVAMRIAHGVSTGDQTLSIDLHPAELGHVGVQLSFHDGSVSVQMTISRQDTFDSFSRDRGALEQQLAQAGVNLGSGGLDLRFGQPQGQPGFFGQAAPARVAVPRHVAAVAAPPSRLRVSDNLLDIVA